MLISKTKQNTESYSKFDCIALLFEYANEPSQHIYFLTQSNKMKKKKKFIHKGKSSIFILSVGNKLDILFINDWQHFRSY